MGGVLGRAESPGGRISGGVGAQRRGVQDVAKEKEDAEGVKEKKVLVSAHKASLTQELHLNLSHRSLTMLPPIVRVAPLLQSIDLSHNSLTTLPLEELLELEAMTKLDVSYNRLTEMPTPPPRPYSDEVLWRLTSLDCSFNMLAAQPDIVGSLPCLTFLDLSGNPVTSLDAGTLHQATSLTGLGIGGGTVSLDKQGLADSLAELSSLKYLKMASHVLGEEPWVMGMERMSPEWGEELAQAGHGEAQDAAVTSEQEEQDEGAAPRGGGAVHQEGGGTARATSQREGLVSMAFEEEEAPEGVQEEETDDARRERETREEDLRQKKLEEERSAREQQGEREEREEAARGILSRLWTIQDLTRLDLSSNKLRHLPVVLGGLPNLTALDLSDNLLLRVPQGALSASSLTSLSVRANHLVDWPPGLTLLGALSTLDVSWNQIAQLPAYGVDADGDWTDGVLAALTTITQLDISANTIRDLRPALLMPSLSHLIFKGNPVVQPSREGLSAPSKEWVEEARKLFVFEVEEEKQEAEKERLAREEAEAVKREADNLRRIAEAMKDFRSMMDELDADD